jgi:hypothetical protein
VPSIFLDRGNKTSTLTAQDAPEVLTQALAACKEHKAKLDRWTFYVPEIADKLPKTAKLLDPKAVAAIADRDDVEIKLTLGKFGKPRLVVAKPLAGKRKSKFVDIC